jgi:formylglycine-generating enzyme required for sulfatase activity
MVWISPGAFLMGTPASDPDKSVNELSQFQASFSHGFWMGQLEVTQSQYQNLMCTNPARFKGDLDRPVETVSYNDALEYCTRLTQLERAAGRLPDGYSYRLPTEAEWEYAARAGSTNIYFFGDDPLALGAYGWYSSNSQGSPHRGGLLQANPWQLHDTCGNVYEWCLDWIDAVPSEPAVDYRGTTTGSYRGVRGGTWGFRADQCRSSWRLNYPLTVRFATLGFRIVLAVDP